VTLIVVIGWFATVLGATLGVPQLVHLARSRNVEGLSLVAWQAWLTVGVAWAVHGLRIGQLPQAVTATVSLSATVPILYLLAQQAVRRLRLVLLPGLLSAAVMIAADQIFGSAVFGVIAIVPAVISNAGQSLELVRADHVRGVSAPFIWLGMLNQLLWLVWAVLVADPGTLIAASTGLAITTFNLGWYILRRLGLRAFRYPRRVGTAVPVVD
jgi:uncharacterized protein with PQ loop repeat